MRGREYTLAGGLSLAETLLSLFSFAFISFCSAIFCPIMQASFCLFHCKKKISIFDLSCFCSSCSCFLLFMKFLNTARISSLFSERPHSVQFSVHCSPMQALAEFQNQPAVSNLFTLSSRHLWHLVWAPFPRTALPLSLSVSATQPSLLCVGLAGTCPWLTCVDALHGAGCKTEQQQLHLGLYVQFSHVHVITKPEM